MSGIMLAIPSLQNTTEDAFSPLLLEFSGCQVGLGMKTSITPCLLLQVTALFVYLFVFGFPQKP